MHHDEEQHLEVTGDEQRLLDTLRTWAGGPYLTALTPTQLAAFQGFMRSMRGNGEFSTAIH